jgi:hypothetical protein
MNHQDIKSAARRLAREIETRFRGVAVRLGRAANEVRHAGRTVWHCWPAYLTRYYLRQTWDDMPGPWWVKVPLIVVCLLIPGPQDELILIGLTRVFRAWRARQARKVPAGA